MIYCSAANKNFSMLRRLTALIRLLTGLACVSCWVTGPTVPLVRRSPRLIPWLIGCKARPASHPGDRFSTLLPELPPIYVQFPRRRPLALNETLIILRALGWHDFGHRAEQAFASTLSGTKQCQIND